MGYNHPEHGEIVGAKLQTRVHDGVAIYKCERCGVMAKFDEADTVFNNHNCDEYQSVKVGVSDFL